MRQTLYNRFESKGHSAVPSIRRGGPEADLDRAAENDEDRPIAKSLTDDRVATPA
jgi:hypothetical protein